MTKCSGEYELYMDNPSLVPQSRDSFFCGNITKSQVDNFLNELSKYESIPESGCFGCIRAYVLTRNSKRISVSATNNNQNSEKFYNVLQIDFDKEKCKCSNCLGNIKTGKCKDDFVREVVGTTLFSKMYVNQK